MFKRVLVVLAAAVASISSASAADLGARPVYKAEPVAVAYNWSGFYIGGHVGWAWQDSDATLTAQPLPTAFPLGTVFSTKSDGFLGGGQVGVNWQMSNWVFGLEGDFSWTDADGSQSLASPFIPGLNSNGTQKFNWFATATGRVGYAWNNWLLYAKGGAAFTEVELGGTVTVGGVLANTINSQKDTRSGWTVGAGIENGFAGNWSWKLEYNYMDFGTTTYNFTTTPATGTVSFNHDLTVQAVKFGINYRFGMMH